MSYFSGSLLTFCQLSVKFSLDYQSLVYFVNFLALVYKNKIKVSKKRERKKPLPILFRMEGQPSLLLLQ